MEIILVTQRLAAVVWCVVIGYVLDGHLTQEAVKNDTTSSGIHYVQHLINNVTKSARKLSVQLNS